MDTYTSTPLDVYLYTDLQKSVAFTKTLLMFMIFIHYWIKNKVEAELLKKSAIFFYIFMYVDKMWAELGKKFCV